LLATLASLRFLSHQDVVNVIASTVEATVSSTVPCTGSQWSKHEPPGTPERSISPLVKPMAKAA
jgi:hypothetical protein